MRKAYRIVLMDLGRTIERKGVNFEDWEGESFVVEMESIVLLLEAIGVNVAERLDGVDVSTNHIYVTRSLNRHAFDGLSDEYIPDDLYAEVLGANLLDIKEVYGSNTIRSTYCGKFLVNWDED